MKERMEKDLVVAAFDFDGTVTYRDTLLSFLLHHSGAIKTAGGLTALLPYLAKDLLFGAGRQQMKEHILSHFFQGSCFEKLRESGEKFAERVVVRPSAVRRLEWHKNRGHRCILISASIDLYLEPWRRKMGFDDLLCSKVEVDARGKMTGRLKGSNCRGAEKVRRLQKLLALERSHYTLYAYGDSAGDRELLAFADYPFMKEMPNG